MSTESKSPMHKPIVLCGPSGVGKGTLVNLLFIDWAECFAKKISHTTRAARADEVHGVHYYFITRDDFERDIKENKFIEHALVHGNYYGTAIASVQAARAAGKIVVLELDVQGVQQLQAITKANPDKGLDCTYIWIAPPNYDELINRLKGRGTESDESLKRRLATAQAERMAVEEHPELFDYVLVNDSLNDCYYRFNEIIAKLYPHMAEKIAAKRSLIQMIEGSNAPTVLMSRTPSEILREGPADVVGTPAHAKAVRSGLTPALKPASSPTSNGVPVDSFSIATLEKTD